MFKAKFKTLFHIDKMSVDAKMHCAVGQFIIN